MHIAAVTVNHNTSVYAELLLRSLFATHPGLRGMSVTVLDNHSQDDMRGLQAVAVRTGTPIIQTGFDTNPRTNSHGEILGRFVRENPDCSYYLFLDSDVCFLEQDTINTMLDELAADKTAFGIGARLSSDAVNDVPGGSENEFYVDRLHPACALVRNTELFRRAVEEIGLTLVTYHWVGGDACLDTFQLMSKTMRTHGVRPIVSSRMVFHFFSMSHTRDPAEMGFKNGMLERLMRRFGGEVGSIRSEARTDGLLSEPP